MLRHRSTAPVPHRWVVLALAAIVAWAPRSAATDLRLNEIAPVAGEGPQTGFVHSRVELYNTGGASESAGGLVLVNAAGTTIATLPAWSVPPQGFLTVVFGNGTDDSDLGDGSGTYFTQTDSLGVFEVESDECALYDGGVVAANIADYVAWSRVGAYAGGYSAVAAQDAGLWTANDFVDMAAFGLLSTLGLAPDGFDHDTASDWVEYDWGSFFVSSGSSTLQNPLQLFPAHGSVLEAGAPDLLWVAITAADSVRLEVDDDSTFASPNIAVDTTSTSFTVTSALADGQWFWRVLVYSGGTLVPEHAAWTFVKLWTYFPKAGGGEPPRTGATVPGFTPLIQHKDTRLLCIYNSVNSRRPGCDRLGTQASGPWDNAHAITAAHVPGCGHCSMYCTRAVIAMINNKYGGDLSQDRIAYQLFNGAEPGLGHRRGTFLNERFPVLAWSLGVAQNQITNNAGRPTFATLKTEIDAGRPIYIDGNDHATCCYGYYEIVIPWPFPPFFKTLRLVVIANPWPGTGSLFLYDYWQPDGSGWGAANHFLLPAAGITAQNQEASVSTDTDGDGVMDFDEANRFCSQQNNTDSDRDQISDYNEIFSYTFHSTHHAHNTNAVGFSDVDADTRRTECDCDSDDDSDYDGGEDVNANGTNPQAGETDVYRATSHLMDVTVTTPACGAGQAQPTPAGGTLHAGDTFGVDIEASNPCQPPADGAGLGVAGLVSTGADGSIANFQLGCYPPGTYRMVIDAIPNGTYDPGCDVVVCFTIDAQVPVGIEALSAMSSNGIVRLSWRMTPEAAAGTTAVRIERAELESGPWASLGEPRVPAAAMEFTDESGETGREYWYRIVFTAAQGEPFVAGPVEVTVMGSRFDTALYTPAGSRSGAPVEIRYSVGLSGTPVTVALFDVRGRRVRELASGPHAQGLYTARWDRRDASGSAVARGIYFVRMTAGARELTRKLVLATE